MTSQTATDEPVTWWTTIWQRMRHFIAGSASGVALVLAGHAFDTIKVRLQTEQTGKFRGPIHCLVKTLKEEGIRGLYKGATPPMVATGFINSVMFGLMGICRQNLMRPGQLEPTIPQVMFCGMTTGWLLSLIVTPIEGIKARLQVQYALPPGSTAQFKGPIDCARQLLRLGGIRALYAGWVPTIFHRGSNWSYFGAYEAARRFLTPAGKEGKLTPLASLLAGGIAGTSFWLSCYPIDVIKNRMQTQSITQPKYKGLIHCARTIMKEEGWRAFFKGLSPCLIRSVPANSAAFFTFELVYHSLPK
jgi:solute carrier family 25 carnitine/acylcarnitine transporter 20/29